MLTNTGAYTANLSTGDFLNKTDSADAGSKLDSASIADSSSNNIGDNYSSSSPKKSAYNF